MANTPAGGVVPRCFDCGIENEPIIKHRCAVCREVRQGKVAVVEPAMKFEVRQLEHRTRVGWVGMAGCTVVAVIGLADGTLTGGLWMLAAVFCALLLAVVNVRHDLRIRDLTREMLDMYAPLPSALTEPVPKTRDWWRYTRFG